MQLCTAGGFFGLQWSSIVKIPLHVLNKFSLLVQASHNSQDGELFEDCVENGSDDPVEGESKDQLDNGLAMW